MRQALNEAIYQGDQHRVLALDHGELAYRQIGLSHLPALLFIHGWGGSSRYWLPVMRTLADAFCCYALDLPGFGHSPPLATSKDEACSAHSHRGLSRIIGAFMAALDIETCDVVGHSYGAGVAIALAAAQPHTIRRLIVSNFSTFRDERERRLIDVMHTITSVMVMARRLPLAKSEAFVRALSWRYFYRPPSDPRILRQGWEDFMQMDARTAELTVKASLSWETPRALTQLPMPALFIHCHHDQIMPPRNAAYTANLAPRSRLVWIDDCGHLPMVEKTASFVHAVREFLCGEQG
jgi:pimeloyl-ACP methyl ester carboxylesterase